MFYDHPTLNPPYLCQLAPPAATVAVLPHSAAAYIPPLSPPTDCCFIGHASFCPCIEYHLIHLQWPQQEKELCRERCSSSKFAKEMSQACLKYMIKPQKSVGYRNNNHKKSKGKKGKGHGHK